MSVRWFLLLGLLAIYEVSVTSSAHGEPPPRRWLYLQQNLQVAENLPKIEALLRRAAKVGYNGVVLADYKLNILDRVPDHYFRNAERFKAVCRELQLEIIPTVTPFGYSAGILAHDPNLAEALPVKNSPFSVQDDVALPANGNKDLVPGEFEEYKGHELANWRFQDEAGTGTYVDTEIKHGGLAALRIEKGTGTAGNRRINKRLPCRRWTQFHASVWIRTQDFEAAESTRMFAMNPEGRVLSFSNLGVQRNQDWTQHHIVFNSLDGDYIQFYAGVWGCEGGKLWMDDLRLVEEPFVNLVRRPGCPLVVQNQDGTTTYEEGRDYSPLADPGLGTTPYPGDFNVYHLPPQLKFPKGSRIKHGQKLQVSFYHAVTIYNDQVPCSLSEPKVFEIVEDQVRRIQKLFEPRTFFLSHDEIRVANWSQPEQQAGQTAGQVLAENVRKCVKIIRQINPQSRLCIWSDMFDPHHNAEKEFYLVHGDLTGSWEGLPADMSVINWNSGKAAKSLPFFAKRGHSQVLAGYYDGAPEDIRRWQAEGKGLKGIDGAMYTTWKSNFADLEKFAEAAWGGAGAK
ncbi:MAG: hypothetical protein V4719_05350 [Planctomycetota bacterium]